MTIGRQLYPPRLIRPPEAFDDLFNNLQVVNCATSRHPFQKNVLCLICGQLLCDICFPNLSQLLFQVVVRSHLLFVLHSVHMLRLPVCPIARVSM